MFSIKRDNERPLLCVTNSWANSNFSKTERFLPVHFDFDIGISTLDTFKFKTKNGIKCKSRYLHLAMGLGKTTPAVYTAWNIPSMLTRLVISRIKTGATRFDRSFLCTQRKLISTILCFLEKKSILMFFVLLNNIAFLSSCQEKATEVPPFGEIHICIDFFDSNLPLFKAKQR